MSEPILICYDGSAGFEAEPRGELANATWQGMVGAGVSQQVAEHAGRPVLIVPPPR